MAELNCSEAAAAARMLDELEDGRGWAWEEAAAEGVERCLEAEEGAADEDPNASALLLGLTAVAALPALLCCCCDSRYASAADICTGAFDAVSSA